ncbi:MAG: hypothetical protein BWY54_00937 [Candidatus Dependentiae bacterium ADurb.Bin331]|nr:MAG: hypothetical protein BWY54_00937 [Candidatus Dependentiae bacterium ADurb.Bin331]
MKLRRIIIFALMVALTSLFDQSLLSMIQQRSVRYFNNAPSTIDIGIVEAKISEAKVRYGHDTRLLHRAYAALVTTYPGILGMTCWGNVPPGGRKIDELPNPGYMSSPGSGQFCYLYFLPIVQASIASEALP